MSTAITVPGLENLGATGLVTVGLILSFLDIPFGDGILAYIGMAIVGELAARVVSTVYPMLAIHVKMAAVGVGMLAAALSVWRRRYKGTAVISAVAGYVTAMGVDAMAIAWNIGAAIGVLFLIDRLIEIARGATTSIAYGVMYTALSTLVPGLGVAMAEAMAFTGILLARFTQMVYCRLVTGISSLIASLGKPAIVLLVSVSASLVFSVIPAIAWSLVILLTAIAFFVLAAAAAAHAATIVWLVVDGVAAFITAIGLSMVGGGLLRSIRRAGGRRMAEVDAAMTVALVLAAASMAVYKPILVVAVAAWALGTVVSAARILAAMPRRRLADIVAQLFSLAVFYNGVEMIRSAVGTAMDLIAKAIGTIAKLLPFGEKE